MSAIKPLITIITAVYNGEAYIEETINSVLVAASEISFEYLVIDDGSTDGTASILTKFDKKIRVITKNNSGESASVTIGFQEALGEFVMVLSADDPLFTPKIFENVFEQFQTDENLVAVYPDWRMIGSEGEVLKIIKVPDYSDDLMIGQCKTLPGPGVIIRKSAALKIGGRRKKWVFVGDYDFWLRLSTVGEIRHRDDVLSQWRMHPGSTSISKRGPKMAEERIAVIEEFTREFPISKSLKRRALGTAYYMAARLIFFDPEVKGKRYLVLAYIKSRGLIPEAKISIVLYILLHPLSFWIYKRFKRFFPEQLPLQ